MNNTINEECLEIAKLLTKGDSLDELGFNIIPSKIDYSIDSLNYVDEILSQVHDNKDNFTPEVLNKVFLRFGCYCGEVIRKESKNYTWLTFEEAVASNPDVATLGSSIFTHYVLSSEKTSNVIFPISKVSKYVESGNSESLLFYAKTVIDQEEK